MRMLRSEVEPFLGRSGTLNALVEMEGDAKLKHFEKKFFWLDYFCLKQCAADFNLHLILGLIKRIGFMVASIDRDFEYVERKFCILEAYAGVADKDTKLVAHHSGGDSGAGDRASRFRKSQIDTQIKINCAEAKTRNKKHAEIIDDFIKNGTFLYDAVGYEEIDKTLKKSADRSAVWRRRWCGEARAGSKG